MTIDQILKELTDHAYIAERSIAMSVLLAIKLEKPLLIEGPAGVGKTEVAKVMSKIIDTDLIRLQCYEGVDSNQALYEWHYQKKLLYLKMMEGQTADVSQKKNEIYSEEFLMERPLLKAIQRKERAVLLIDEIDRADEEFESFLLELLSDWQITIPELGTIQATSKPFIILTGNRTRELSEALRRRCLYLWIDYPEFEKELQIVHSKLPQVNKKLAEQICLFMEELRQMKLEKTPGVAETLDWAQSLAALHFEHLEKEVIEDTLGVVLKDWQDIRKVTDSLSELLEKTGVVSKIG